MFQSVFACNMSTCQRHHTFRSVCACDTRPIVTSHIILCRCATPHITVFLSFAPSVHPTFRLTGYPYFSLRLCAYQLFVLPSIHVSLRPRVLTRQTGPLRSAPSSRVASRQVTASSPSAPHLVRVPVRPCVRMTIRLSGTLQLSLRPCVRVSA